MNASSASDARSGSTGSRPLLSALSLLILIGIASRIFLLNWYRGEYTDGILQIQLFENKITYYPPLYTLVVRWAEQVVGDALLAGRLISLLASTLVMVPLYHLACRVFSRQAALWACVLYLAAAVPNRWSLRVMSDSLFTFFFVLSVMGFVFSLSSPRAEAVPNLPRKRSAELMLALARVRLRRWCFLLLAAAGLATLTRYQGLALIPLILVSLYRNRRGYTKWELLETLMALAPWAALGYWLWLRGFGHPGQFMDRVHDKTWETLLAYWDMAETFVLYFPYALTIPVFMLVIAGLILKPDASGGSRILRWTLAYLFALWLPIHAAFQSFQYRYFLPLVPLMMVFAGQGMVMLGQYFRSRRWRSAASVQVLVVLQSLLFSAAVLYFQRNAFADVTEVGHLIAGRNLTGGRIFAAETYNPGNYNIKLSYLAQQPIPYYEPIEQFDFRPGDYIVLSNFYNPFERAYQALSTRYTFEVFYRTQYYHLIPLLPDIMVFPEPQITSQPTCMAYRFHRQTYYSNIIRITGTKP